MRNKKVRRKEKERRKELEKERRKSAQLDEEKRREEMEFRREERQHELQIENIRLQQASASGEAKVSLVLVLKCRRVEGEDIEVF